MRHKGSVCDYNEERDEALRKLFVRKLAERRWRRVDDIFVAMRECGAPRFYVSEMRALSVLRHRRRTGEFPVMGACRLELYEELWKRYCERRVEQPGADDYDIVFDIVNSPAPSFYLTVRSLRTILYRARRKSRA